MSSEISCSTSTAAPPRANVLSTLRNEISGVSSGAPVATRGASSTTVGAGGSIAASTTKGGATSAAGPARGLSLASAVTGGAALGPAPTSCSERHLIIASV